MSQVKFNMKLKNKNSKSKELKSLSNVSNAFCFDTHFDFHSNNYNNYRSIFSYKTIESDENEIEKETNYYFLTIFLSFLMILFFPIFGWFSLKVITRNYKLAVFRYGKLLKIIDSGITFVIPLIDSCKYIDTTVKATSITAASCPTKDHGLVEIDCLIKYRIIDPTFLIINVKNWTEFFITETRVALLMAMKYFRWSDFNDTRITCDLENQISKLLISSVDAKGLEICEVHVENVNQKKEPETPMDMLKKINFKDLGRQLSSMTPIFMNSAMNGSRNAETDAIGSNKTALVNFFEKLEIIKTIAINNMAQQKLEKSAVSNELIDTEIRTKLEILIKDFVRHNISGNDISRILFEKSLKPLFENTVKVAELSIKIKEVKDEHNINKNILFDVTNYFKYPCHFHYSCKEDILLHGTVEDAITITF